MDSVFEIEIIAQKYFGYRWTEKFFSVLGVKKIHAFTIFASDDWTLENEDQCDNWRDIDISLLGGKIIRIECENSDTDCGVFIYQEEEHIHYSLWCKCMFSSLDKSYIDSDNKHVYEALYTVMNDLIECQETADCVLVAMGAELFFEVIYPLEKTLPTAKNVCAWIVGKSHPVLLQSVPSDFILRNDVLFAYVYEKKGIHSSR